MEIKTIKNTKTELDLEITGENETIMTPLSMVLMDDANVGYAACITEHPLSNKRRILIRTTKGTPKTALSNAIKSLQSEIKDFQTHIEKSPKKKK